MGFTALSTDEEDDRLVLSGRQCIIQFAQKFDFNLVYAVAFQLVLNKIGLHFDLHLERVEFRWLARRLY